MNALRIIGGDWRRRVLRFPDLPGVRPTPSRVRETLFNWLGQDLSGTCCLDLFAGSGALGFEAASRGAAKVVLVDASPKVVAALTANARMLGAEARVEVLRSDAVRFALHSRQRFDIIFLDPPFHGGWLVQLAPLAECLLAPDGVLYVEAERAVEACGAWRTVRSDRAGQVYFHLMRRGETDGT
ncbi:MAG TPA: 16S rRNA (guanine(966)-N(2))-methyltransferase RsmD [Accumulibacter sp.]|uniref:16S rRNA (guanine(966)-N(2))-methyltransferase RsmD n=1 Tax=Accumulibacter sp. TaxID=2053492 RepID=UPI00287B4DCD|nr:16S rRNA (guanine(966)-N(2))-methyltransferase RsmD [Accumulibacter sp.]MDS4055483.1 16S rRNA (guanine(966)-N(2))-methyltransferase RsmD [Accumulibacter sp.]HNB68742.1 16S rRNA (guanine(966)-N(2))-methyltransferase RsmD [Accumulibacter sp.]HNC27845.1 16S rRNA (guanine(966)-N(2))-methyltransferase RsmD [Accumulibacter sp.]HNE41073.1 16S rRNA (guanine(966)-N(2))-methyltransferase RsmD [Accumulibacter sp.]HNG87760.1 16S rRNA (guanine(966)-N(2))-methyltransferase RsmD [Accumulibacter sp.]